MDYDVLVIGSGIGGMESSIKLADMGYKVLLVEKEASVGGRMILLSQGLPDPRLRLLHLGPEDVVDDQPPQHHDDGLQPGREHRRSWRTGASPPRSRSGPSSSTGLPAPAATPARRPARLPSPTSSTPTSPPGARPTSRSRRPCRRRPSCSARARRRASAPARPASRPTATSRWSAAASTRRRSSSSSTPRRSSAPSGEPATRPCESECTRVKLEGPVPIRLLKRFAADKHYARRAAPEPRPSRSPSPTARRSPSSAPARPA